MSRRKKRAFPAKHARPGSDQAESILQRGIEHHRRGAFREAEHCYQLVLRDHPNHAEALNLLGTLAIEAKRYDRSVTFLEKAVRQAPKNAGYRNNLANSLIFDGQPEQAAVQLRKAIAMNPRMIEAHLNMVRAQRAMGKSARALESVQKALRIAPDFVPAWLAEAEVLTELGHVEEATAAFRRVLELEPENPAAVTGLVVAHRFSTDDTDITQIEAVISRLPPDDNRRAAFHHAAGKIYNDLEDFDAAVSHFARGKLLAGSAFDLAAYRRHVDELQSVYTKPYFLERRDHGNDSDRPVFIVGMPRSGTTLAEQIVASHPKAAGAGELGTIELILNRVTQLPRGHQLFGERLKALREEDVRKHAETYLAVLKRKSRAAQRVVDKMPHNFEALGLIALMFPRARVVHCLRDPMDTCVSCFTNHFAEAHGYNTDLATLGAYYREYRRLMDHWAAVLPINMLNLQYEELIADQEGVSRRLVDFLGLDWDDACLRFHETERAVQTPSARQVRQPIYSSSIDRWKRYDKHLGPLKDALGDFFLGSGETAAGHERT